MAGILPEGMKNVADLGILPENTPEKNSEAVEAAQAPDELPVSTSQRWLFGAGDYNFARTLKVIRPLWIEGIGGSWSHPRTRFTFPAGMHGIHIHGSTTDLSLNAGGAGISNIRLDALGMSTVAHGVVVEGTCNLSHMLIELFRGDGLHVRASSEDKIPIKKRANANMFRFNSVRVGSCGNSVDVKSMTRGVRGDKRILTITTAGPHHLQVDDIIWLEPINPDPNVPFNPDPNFPRANCSVESIVGPGETSDTFDCRHFFAGPIDGLPDVPDGTIAHGIYKIVVGHGIFTLGSDANNGTCFSCLFENNAGWGVMEHSAGGNSYWACEADLNKVGPYYTHQASGEQNLFMGCYTEDDPKLRLSAIETPAILIGGTHDAGLTGSGLHILKEKSTQLAFVNGSGGKVTLGSRDPGSTRYMAFENTTDGLDANQQLSIDFDQAAPGYTQMLGLGSTEIPGGLPF